VSTAVAPQRRRRSRAAPAAAPYALSLRNVSKSFRLPHEQYRTLKQRALHLFRQPGFDILRAVEDVTLEIKPGEFFGIVGRNGSGKSTLLKCLAGIYQPDGGEITVNGRLAPFIELGVGFNMELTARDNVIINAIMLGLSRREARSRFDDIIAFAELEDFIDLKLKNYSSGMYVRLAFATAVQVDADILLIDEVLAVGDARFQQKCFDTLTRLQREGRTMVFVTHDMGAVERFCDRAMLLEHGRVLDVSDASTIARKYNEQNFRYWRSQSAGSERELPPERPAARVLDARFESPDGEALVSCPQGVPLLVRMQVRFAEPVSDPVFSISLMNEGNHPAFATNTDARRIKTGHFPAGSEATVLLELENYLAPGRYVLVASVANAGFGADVIDAHLSNSIIVLPDRPGGGLADLPHRLEIKRR
jgi:ABC-type polysaccharide/polyol phosphate transport system ATPase subunit